MIDSDDGLVQNSSLRNNSGDEISLDNASTSNDLRGNKPNLNTDFGMVDRSASSGTSGTANTYMNNTCSGNTSGDSSPVGLCS